jgi:mannose-1-phosphate guanylyltransferase
LRSMINQHIQKKSFVTMSLYEYKTNLPYGVIETTKTGKVIAWNEKPEIKANINMGCYVMEPGVMDLIPKNIPYGMDDVIKKAMAKKKPIDSIISKKGFLDIGNKTSYKKANQEFLQRLGNI